MEQARGIIQSTRDLVIVDVRTAEEFKTGHIEGAVSLCVCNQEELLRSLDPKKETLVYCLSGTRSKKAMMILNENGFNRVYNMVGGITKWIEAGYATTQS